MKKGFTLVELLVTIAILGVLLVIIIPNISKIRESIIEKSYEGKVNSIKSAAEEYAYDNLDRITTVKDGTCSDPTKKCYTKCNHVTVVTLIEQGYISGDKNDKKTLIDPRNNSSMNDIVVCIKYDITAGFDKRIMVTELK